MNQPPRRLDLLAAVVIAPLMPSLDRLKKTIAGNPDINVIAISVDRASLEQVRAFYSLYEIKYLPLLLGDEDAVMTALQIGGLPTTLLLDPDGLEIGRLIGPTTWDNSVMIKQLSALVAGTNEASTMENNL